MNRNLYAGGSSSIINKKLAAFTSGEFSFQELEIVEILLRVERYYFCNVLSLTHADAHMNNNQTNNYVKSFCLVSAKAQSFIMIDRGYPGINLYIWSLELTYEESYALTNSVAKLHIFLTCANYCLYHIVRFSL